MGKVFYVPESVMVIHAHPDDAEYSCAGTVSRWVKAGARAAFVLCTSGDVGIAEPGMTRARATEIREAESRNAAAILGVNDITFLREPDGLLEATLGLRKQLVRQIRRFKPEVVICGDPTVVWSGDNYINHPDHRAAALAAIDAVFPAAGQPNLFSELESEGYKAHKPRKVYVSGVHQSMEFISIDETIDLKIAALRAHQSQMSKDPEPWVRSRAAERAAGKEMQYAETFRVVTLIDDAEWEHYRSR